MSSTANHRERRLILDASPCDVNLYPDGPKTSKEAVAAGPSRCPYYERCDGGGLDPTTGWQCVMQLGVQVAQQIVKQGNTVQEEVRGDFKQFLKTLNPPKGFVWSPDRNEFVVITDKEDVLLKVETFAASILGVESNAPAPQSIGDAYIDVVIHASTPDGIDLSLVQELEGRFGGHCDVRHGPCSCGGQH